MTDGQQDTIDTLHSKGKHVVCYISIGTVEDWRDDANEFPSRAIGGGVAGWAGEQWLDVKDPVRIDWSGMRMRVPNSRLLRASESQ